MLDAVAVPAATRARFVVIEASLTGWPMGLQGIIIPILTYVFTKIIALAPLPHVQFELWYAPYPIGTIMNIMSQGAGALVRALIFLVVSVAVSSAIWYPFFKAYETKRVQEEQEKIAAK